MIRIACSTGIRSTAPLGAACRAIAEIGFRYADPLAIEGWHISPAQIAAGEGMTLALETHAGAIAVHPAAPAWP
jgi:hypothetical protein